MVRITRQVNKDKVLCFLRAEMDSPTEALRLTAALELCGLAPDILTEPDLQDADESRARRDLFNAYRGTEPVFAGLPWRDLTWYEATLSEADLRTRTFSCRNHFASTYATRSIDQIAALWDRENSPGVNGVVARIRRGDSLQPPILMAQPALDRMVILEGHNRLISYLRNPSVVTFPLPALVGVSSDTSQWSQW